MLMELSKTPYKVYKTLSKQCFKCHNHQGINFLTRIHHGLSHLPEHKFKHSFQDLLNSLWKCGFDELTSHFLLHCPIYNNGLSSLLIIRSIHCQLVENTDCSLTQTVLYGNSSLDINTNSLILNTTTDFTLKKPFFKEIINDFFFCLILKKRSTNLSFR